MFQLIVIARVDKKFFTKQHYNRQNNIQLLSKSSDKSSKRIQVEPRHFFQFVTESFQKFLLVFPVDDMPKKTRKMKNKNFVKN